MKGLCIPALLFSMTLIIGCGQESGEYPLGTLGGGTAGYGGFGGSDELTVLQKLLGTWRNYPDSPYYRQYKFDFDGRCEISMVNIETEFYEEGTFEVRTGRLNQISISSPHYYFDAPFYFDYGDLVFVGEGGNFVYHRVR